MSARRGRLTAWTGISGQDQLEACRIASVHLAASEGDHAGLQWRTKRLDDGRLELRRLIEEENAFMGESVTRFYDLDII